MTGWRHMPGHDVVKECEALLDGRATGDRSRGRQPPWVWMNLLAHGSEADLRRAVGDDIFSASSWRRNRALVAAELVDMIDDGASLVDLQRAILVPLELDLLAMRRQADLDPQRFFSGVLQALAGYRRSSA